MKLLPEGPGYSVRLSDEASSFALRVVDYAYPHISDCKYDSNWLRIAIRTATPRGQFERMSACMLAQEAHWLSAWLQGVANGDEPLRWLEFLEPTLRFGWAATTERDRIRISVLIADSLHPDWPSPGDPNFLDRAGACNRRPVAVVMECERGALLQAAYALARELRRFPIRGETR